MQETVQRKKPIMQEKVKQRTKQAEIPRIQHSVKRLLKFMFDDTTSLHGEEAEKAPSKHQRQVQTRHKVSKRRQDVKHLQENDNENAKWHSSCSTATLRPLTSR